MKKNSYISHSILYRLRTFKILSENEVSIYLLPELLLKIIQDYYYYQNNTSSYANIVNTVENLGIICSEEELEILTKIEHSLRKAEDYMALVLQIDIRKLISIAQKIEILSKH